MDDNKEMMMLQSDWYSPRRLHDSPSQYHFPGDRFIPNRSLMNLDQVLGSFTNSTTPLHNPNFSPVYRRRLSDSLTLDSEGKPFRMLVFRGSPKSSRKSLRLIDEMRREDADALSHVHQIHHSRRLPEGEARILDAPNIRNDYYVNIIDWGKNNLLAVALGRALYLWNSESQAITKLSEVQFSSEDCPVSVSWSHDSRSLAVGYMCSKLELWDVETSKCIRSLQGHTSRIAAISWNSHTVTSGSRDKSITNHDVRAGSNPVSCIIKHSDEVCGLKWSRGGNMLASGGNENSIYIWEASKMSSSQSLHQFTDHCAAVKALAWCPYQFGILASGGGTNDRCIKIWNTQNGSRMGSIDTEAQICGLEWNMHHKEILSGHGYGRGTVRNQLCIWKYPSLKRVGELRNHRSRIINLAQSPDGLTVVSAGGDETLRFWEIFGPPCKEKLSELDSLLSLKTSPLR
ncbi:Cell division cycle 20.1, cofactor of APC complex [Linum perenne]